MYVETAMPTLRIGELAKAADVGVETVRFYERKGLLEVPQRKASGYRQYDEETVQVLQFIRRAKELGFTLKEIKSLLELRSDVSSPRAEVKQQAEKKVGEIDVKIAQLQRMRNGLMSLVGQCHGDGSIVGCPILDALQGMDQR
jgi:MerR family copper efflux transcriptional regulator